MAHRALAPCCIAPCARSRHGIRHGLALDTDPSCVTIMRINATSHTRHHQCAQLPHRRRHASNATEHLPGLAKPVERMASAPASNGTGQVCGRAGCVPARGWEGERTLPRGWASLACLLPPSTAQTAAPNGSAAPPVVGTMVESASQVELVRVCPPAARTGQVGGVAANPVVASRSPSLLASPCRRARWRRRSCCW